MKTQTLEHDEIRQQVRDRYGRIARTQGRGCGCGDKPAFDEIKLSNTHAELLGYAAGDAASVPEGSEMGLGCGNPTALASITPGETILDLGSGGGFDCFLAAKQTGPAGRVIGIDMTPDMVSKARSNAARGGYDNVEFRLGEIEALPVADAQADLVISNCVINLSPDKPRVYAEAFRALKPGGRLAVSDIVALAEIPPDVRADFAAYTGCIAGASRVEDQTAWLEGAGFVDVRIDIKEESRAFIDEWLPGKHAGKYAASASITARKPDGTCCGPSCCGDEHTGSRQPGA